MQATTLIGLGLLIATLTVLVVAVREARRLSRTRPLQFRHGLVQDVAPQIMTPDPPPEPAPAPSPPEPAGATMAAAKDFALPSWPRGVDEKGRPKW